MSVFFWLIIIIAAYGVTRQQQGFHSDYIALNRIQPVKGIFLLLVFLSHFVQYVELNGVWDAPYFEIRRFLGQLVVVPFLFYSGYGIAESIRVKGHSYVQNMPRKRLVKVLLQFDCAVILFLVLRYITGTTYSAKRILLTLLGWEGIGNSNWYIFAILFLYTATYISYVLFPRRHYLPLITLTILTSVFVLVMSRYKVDYWYNRTFAYVAGVWFSCFKKSFETVVLSNERNYRITLFLTGLLFLFLHSHWSSLVPYLATCVVFAVLVVLVTAKLQLRSPFLSYCGEHLFSLFILQRIPMIALNNTAIENFPYLFLLVSFGITVLLSFVFDKLMNKLFR